MNIFEVLELGPIVYGSEEYGVIITINGSYLNWFIQKNELKFECTTCRSFSEMKLNTLTWIKATSIAEDWFNEELTKN